MREFVVNAATYTIAYSVALLFLMLLMIIAIINMASYLVLPILLVFKLFY